MVPSHLFGDIVIKIDYNETVIKKIKVTWKTIFYSNIEH